MSAVPEEPQPLIEKEMDEDGRATGQDTEKLQKQYLQRYMPELLAQKYPWRSVQDAIRHGYVYPGWKMLDYIRATDKGNPNLPQNPYCSCGLKLGNDGDAWAAHLSAAPDHERVPRKSFEFVDTWGVQGASKSAMVFQHLAMLYQDWAIAEKRMILTKDEVIATYEEVMEPDQRIPAANFDDLNTIISKQEWFEDKEFYIMFHKFLNQIRTKFGTLYSTLPNISFTPEMLGGIVTFELIVYPNSTYKGERYCWDIDPFQPLVPKFTKIVIEEPGKPYDIYRTAPQWWNKYQNRRWEIANQHFLAIKEYMAGGGAKGKHNLEATKKAAKQSLQEVPPNLIAERLRSKGYTIDDKKLGLIMKEAKAIALERMQELAPMTRAE